jgi:cytochrome c oxidase assembly protein subunit 15
MKLFPAVVTLHLLGGLVLLALLCRQVVAHAQAQRGYGRAPIAPTSRAWIIGGLALLWFQVALGGWVSTNYAVLACSEFPTCQGSWWPVMDLRQGFELWRELGRTGDGAYFTFPALTAIHYVHRLIAYGVIVVLGIVAWQLRGGALATPSRWIAGLVLWQLGTGYSNVVLGWPLAAAVSHTAGAAALILVLTWALCESQDASQATQADSLEAPERAGAETDATVHGARASR